jgi:hypothetical protein
VSHFLSCFSVRFPSSGSSSALWPQLKPTDVICCFTTMTRPAAAPDMACLPHVGPDRARTTMPPPAIRVAPAAIAFGRSVVTSTVLGSPPQLPSSPAQAAERGPARCQNRGPRVTPVHQISRKPGRCCLLHLPEIPPPRTTASAASAHALARERH